MEESTPELERFREQWQAELSASKTKPKAGFLSTDQQGGSQAIETTARTRPADIEDKNTYDNAEFYSIAQGYVLGKTHLDGSHPSGIDAKSALDHYELAVEKENEGNLGESLDLYRKAFRMDYRVDQNYKIKYFPSNPSNINTKLSDGPVDVSLHLTPNDKELTDSTNQQISSFSNLSIESVSSVTEDTFQCPLAELPDEILVRILTELAICDISSFCRTALVCKRLAHLVSSEESIWKRLCLGSEVGFGAIHYEWKIGVFGDPLYIEQSTLEQSSIKPNCSPQESIAMILYKAYSSSWYQMFRLRPRIRFNGCYISTVKYLRPGEASLSQVSWNSPVHIVTYYRYLRFFRDGTVISLVTTAPPINVVYFLTKELQQTYRNGTASHLSSNIMQKALRGRWHLIFDSSKLDSDVTKSEDEVQIETEGVNTKYLYRMKLAIQSVSNGYSNKLAWRGFWSYNTLNDDLGEFNISKDKPFMWSRVKSYGDGA